jgi:hypothetical protein
MNDVWDIDGTLEPIDFTGYGDDRAPLELAERVIDRFTAAGDWILDPFAGLGSTLRAAGQLGRFAVGIEPNPERVAFVQSGITPPSRILQGRAESVSLAGLPPFALLFCSPPYPTVDLATDPWGPTYFSDMAVIFGRLAPALRPGGTIVVEVSNVSTADGFRPLIAEFSQALRPILRQTGEIIRANRGGTHAGPGVRWSSLLVFSARG